jgi:hypothetical protein
MWAGPANVGYVEQHRRAIIYVRLSCVIVRLESLTYERFIPSSDECRYG